MPIRIRRVRTKWPSRRVYEVEASEAAGIVTVRRRHPPTADLVRAGIHSTDSWEWVAAADRQFDAGSDAWIEDPYE